MLSGGERDGIQGGVNGEVKCSIRLNLFADCWKSMMMPHCLVPAGTAGPSRTT